MKEKRIEKEIKKAQKKGIYNPKLKLGIVALILVIGTVIGVSYAYYTDKSTAVLTISGTVSKKITVTLASSGNGTVSDSPKTVDYGTQAAFTLKPNAGYQYKSTSCQDTSNQDVTSKVTSSYNKSNNTLTLIPKTVNNITCTVTFGEETVKIFNHEYKIKQGDPDFSKGCPTSNNDSCSGVYKMADDSNNDSYYFRGEAKNNYVKFGKGTIKNNTEQQDLIWRIVRINGDGSIRLVLDSDIGKSKFNTNYFERKYVGYTYGNNSPCTNSNPCQSYNLATENEETRGETYHGGENSTIKKYLEDWYYDNLRDYDQYITYGTYCNDTSYGSGSETDYLYYGAYERGMYNSGKPANPQLTCPDPTAERNASISSDIVDISGTKYHTYGGFYKLKIGLLSADEIILAGFRPNGSGVTSSNYLYYTPSLYDNFWSSSPYNSDTSYAYLILGTLSNRILMTTDAGDIGDVRPVINLSASGLKATGEGTKDDPFVIK